MQNPSEFRFLNQDTMDLRGKTYKRHREKLTILASMGWNEHFCGFHAFPKRFP